LEASLRRDRTSKRLQRANTVNKNLANPIPEFPLEMTLGEMRKITGQFSEAAIRQIAQKLKSRSQI
jgi:hypothetical protein